MGLRERAGAVLASRQDAVAERTVARFYDQYPQLIARYPGAGRAYCVADTLPPVSYRAEAIALDSARLFADYVDWAAIMLDARGTPTADLAGNLECMAAAVDELLPR